MDEIHTCTMTQQEQLILVCEKLLGWKPNPYVLPPLTLDLMWEIIGKLTPRQLHRFCVIIGLKTMPNGWQDWRDTSALFTLTKEQILNSVVEAITE
jgi:hypothetical protein